MKKSKESRTPRRSEASRSAAEGSVSGRTPIPEITPPGTTGRYLVLLREDAVKSGVKALSDVAGVTVASTADFDDGAVDSDQLAGAEALIFQDLGVIVVDAPPEQIQAISAATAEDDAILAIEPERIVYAIEEVRPRPLPELPTTLPPTGSAPLPGISVEFLRGYRDAVNHLVSRVLTGSGLADPAMEEAIAPALIETELTWGLQVTKAAASQFSGKGIRVAVLDTGLDLGHPDFAGRHIVAHSFIQGQTAQDGHGHGTHCIGTACGPRQPGQLPRYGIAFNSDIFAGKVLSNQGSGSDGGILGGIQWAITNRCAVVSMSLGARVLPGQGFSPIFEQVARRALAAGTLIIAAAGNDSTRPGSIAPVSHPANCPSIIAVGALSEQLQVAPFSNGGLNPQGGQVDIAGPGVRVRSSWPRPTLYNTISGTSMATPHVSGIGALFAEAHPAARGRILASLLIQFARRLSLPARDVGSGLVQAP